MRATLTLGVLLGLVSLSYALVGQFTVNCAPLTIQRSDPIVSPGIASSHVHAIIGGNAFSRTMIGPYAAANATATTCNKGLDHSNYWVPQMYYYHNNQYTLVQFQGSAHYYQRRACDYAPGRKSCDPNFIPLFFPYGFRMIAGDPLRRTQNNSDPAQLAIDFVCLGGSSPEKGGFPTSPCDRVRAQVYFPSCWDGKNLDPPDHMSHVAYPIGNFNGGVCPQSHPVALVSLFYEFFFNTAPYGNDYTHFALANGDPTGFGLHADFIMGWTDYNAAQNSFLTCVDNAGNCPTLKLQGENPQTLITPAPTENVGLNGPIPQLPGNNPINWNHVEKPHSAMNIAH